ncbi:MAG: hypothetical protein AB1894_19955 [Chloroflexota bacterium]
MPGAHSGGLWQDSANACLNANFDADCFTQPDGNAQLHADFQPYGYANIDSHADDEAQ